MLVSGRARLEHLVPLDSGLRLGALDLALANEPQRKGRTGEAQQSAERQHVVEAGEEALLGRVGDLVPRTGWDRSEGLAEAARRGRLDQLARTAPTRGGGSRGQI